jgi:LPS sulfotransferase NodH
MALRHIAVMQSRRYALAPPRRVLPDFTYVICTNPRSGSWLLSEGLASTSVAGNPREWFNVLEERNARAQWRMEHSADLSHGDYLRLVAGKSTTGNGISGLKLHYYQFEQLSQPLTAAFPNARYIWLTRRDKARQAISFFLASRTEEWWHIDGVASPGRPPVDLDPAAVLRLERQLAANEAGWQAFFRANRITPLVVGYEDLAADYAGTVRGVLGWLGVPGADAVEVPPARLRRQSDERSETWLKAYLDFRAASLPGQPADDTGSPLADRIEQLSVAVSPAWKQWIGQSKLLGIGDAEITEVLVRNGCRPSSATAAVAEAGRDDYLTGAVRGRTRLTKGTSMLNALGELARLDSRLVTVERRAAPAREVFRDRYYAANRPVILTGLMAGWPALTRWTPEYLKRVAGDQEVEVMTGREADPDYETNGSAHRRQMRFADYIDMVHSGRVSNDYYLVANNGFFQRPGTRPLLDDCPVFGQYLQPTDDGQQCFLWYGPAGTVTPLHHDTSNILIAQVSGRKRYRLIPAAQRRWLYNDAGVFSAVDPADPDLTSHPEFKHATVIDVTVQPGEVLFMPVGWWHHALALDVSMTVTFTSFVFPNHFTWEL